MALKLGLTAKKSGTTATVGAAVIVIVLWIMKTLNPESEGLPVAHVIVLVALLNGLFRWIEQWIKHRRG